MSAVRPNRIALPSPRFGDRDNSSSDPGNAAAAELSASPPRGGARVSFSQRMHRPSRGAQWRAAIDEESGLHSPSMSERPPIPSALAASGETFTTPLPVLPMIVLSITMLGEFLSANVSTPFLLKMVEGFGIFDNEADVGYWTGILVSCFFVTQFLTSLLWATAAGRHGTRAVLFVALMGSSLTCFVFGTSTSLQQAIVIRLLQGIFAGAIGVGRGNVATITDPSNEGRAYAILGFCWGLGGVAGAIIGGTFESPMEKWPGVFSTIPLFVNYPYLLPCSIAATVTFSGAIMSLFLGYNGGSREGAIRLGPEKLSVEESVPEEPSTPTVVEEIERPGIVNQLKRQVSKKLSGYFAKRVQDAHANASPSRSTGSPAMPMSIPGHRNSKLRTLSRASRTNGSAYGYSSGAYRNRLASNVSQGLAGRRGSMASATMRRRGSNIEGPDASGEGAELNFAQRLLMANENAVTNIADLWVAAAMNVDNDDPFLSDTDLELDDDDQDPFRDDDDENDEGGVVDSVTSTPTRRGRTSRSSGSLAVPGPRISISQRVPSGGFRTQLGSPRRPSAAFHSPAHYPSPSQMQGPQDSPRRFSTTVPSIFSHVGVRTPPAAIEPPQPLQSRDSGDGPVDGLAPIIEGRPQSIVQLQTQAEPALDTISEKQPSLLSQLPINIIIQYGLLALHSTTHDQVFLSYLVSKYPAGGLNLNPGHFAQLIALMCLAQIAYQFYLYPNIGPPRGRFSHLAMFRIGSLLFIPSYLTVILYRPLASADTEGSLFLMAALAFSNALRYCGITFAYTAIAILLNYMSPPHLLGLANGIAQSIVSFARVVGPILGGYLWAVSVNGHPEGYPMGFIVCAGVTAAAVAHSFFIR